MFLKSNTEMSSGFPYICAITDPALDLIINFDITLVSISVSRRENMEFVEHVLKLSQILSYLVPNRSLSVGADSLARP